MKAIQHVFVGGVKVATLSRADLVDTIIEDCASRDEGSGARLLFDSNGHAISVAASNRAYREALDHADIVHADGGFVVLASRFLAGAAVPDRSATTDLIHDLARAGLRSGLSHFLLGGTEAVNAACAERLRELYPDIEIAGRRNGYFGPKDEPGVLDEIAAANPDVLWIGLGKPREQLFAVRHRERLRAKWAITCGGCFNYITGHYRRAPQWMQEHHLEWLFRAVTTPRLLGRYVTTSPHAIWLALAKADRRTVNKER